MFVYSNKYFYEYSESLPLNFIFLLIFYFGFIYLFIYFLAFKAKAIDPAAGSIAILYYSPGSRVSSCKPCRGYSPDSQCCQRRGLPAQLGYFEILCRGSKNCWAGGLKLGYFSFVCPRQVFFLQICQFPVNSESFWASSMSKNILFINFRD